LARLDDSLSRLIATQDTLKEVIGAEKDTHNVPVDRELTQAYNENVEVM
jgi:hypothetical protein